MKVQNWTINMNNQSSGGEYPLERRPEGASHSRPQHFPGTKTPFVKFIGAIISGLAMSLNFTWIGKFPSVLSGKVPFQINQGDHCLI